MSVEDREEFEGDGALLFLQDPLGIIRRRWPWMTLALLGGLLATAVYGYLWEPRYVASASILISSQEIPENFVQPTVRDDSLARIDAMVGEVLSQRHLTDLIEKYDLYPGPRANVPTARILGKMRSNITIAPERRSGSSRYQSARLYAVSFEAGSPEIAAVIANELAALFSEASIEMRSQQAQLTTQFLSRELERAEQELRAQNRQIREFKERYRGELPSELGANLSKLERLQQQRQSLATQIAGADGRMASILSTLDPSSPEARLAALRASLGQESAVHTDEHPNVVSLRRQIATLEAELAQPGGGGLGGTGSRPELVAAERIAREELQRQLAVTEAALAELDARVAATPARQEELEALTERASVLRTNYLEFLRKVQAAELAESLELAQQGERVSVVDRAAPPGQPNRPLWKYLFAGAAASLALALGVGLLLELWDPVALTADQVESVVGLPVLGSVSRIS
jgi:uncharacterized protein involved in exopolysaccharide biosynthesis